MSDPSEATPAPTRREPHRTRPTGRLVPVDPASDPIELVDSRMVLGRQSSGPLADMSVSRQHAAFEWDPGAQRFVAEDAGGKNGSWIDGVPLGDARRGLVDSSVVRLGDVVFVVELGASPNDPFGIDREAVPGRSAAARRLRAELATASRDPSPVLLLGEPGVGKEFIAREIHRASGRTGAFIAINCADLVGETVERQLFGHAKGAFEGATREAPGLFRSADGGTLLLDNIAELDAALQPKLLRVLQDREVTPIGEDTPVSIDVRVIAATSRELPELVTTGEFRKDLYARLAYWEIWVPTLRERRADIMMWFHRLLAAWTARRGPAPGFDLDAEVVEAIVRAPWVDNLHGLGKLVHKVASQGGGDLASVRPLLGTAEPPPSIVKRPAPTADELRTVLAEHAGSVRAVASYYGRDRKQIYRWIKDLGIE